jgi:predicted RNase H-like HicB family nuclease
MASQALLDRGWGKAKVEVATSSGETYIEALQAAAEVIREAKPSLIFNWFEIKNGIFTSL